MPIDFMLINFSIFVDFFILTSSFLFTSSSMFASFFVLINSSISIDFFILTGLFILTDVFALAKPVLGSVTPIIQKITQFNYIKKTVMVIDYINIKLYIKSII